MSSLYRSIGLLALVVSSCVAAHPPAGSARPALEYTFELCSVPQREVRITLAAQASSAGSTVFALEDGWGGVADPLGGLLRIEARAADGTVRKCTTLEHSRVEVAAAAREPLALSWSIAESTKPPTIEHSEHYRPLLDARRFHLLGPTGLFVPEAIDENTRVAIRWHWKGFAEQGWDTACSFGDDQAGGTTERSPPEFRQAVFLAGHFTREQRTIEGRRLCVAVEHGPWDFEPSELADLAARIVETERRFFNDFDPPFYLISAIAIGERKEHSLSLGGTGLSNSFALFLQPGMKFEPGSPGRAQVQHVLAHEMFHNWCGHGTALQGEEALCYWFTEGFTEFFTRRVLLRCGLTTREEYARDLERSLADYAKSPVRTATNAAIRDGFWKQRELQELPYRRGDLVAALLDGAIRKHSAGKHSLDDFLREAVQLSHAGEKLDSATLVQRIERWTDLQCAERVRRIVEAGEPIELERDLFAPCLAIEDGHVRVLEHQSAADCPML